MPTIVWTAFLDPGVAVRLRPARKAEAQMLNKESVDLGVKLVTILKILTTGLSLTSAESPDFCDAITYRPPNSLSANYMSNGGMPVQPP